MPFFTNKGSKTLTSQFLQDAEESAKTQTYDNADYYIANTLTKASSWTISEYSNPSHDTSKASGETGPEDYGSYYSTANAAKLSIVHEPTKYAVMFPAIIDSYSETFKPTYEAEQLYGRMDDVQKYVNTTRTISVTFKILAYDEDHAHRNLHALSTLAQFLYPVYDYSSNISGSLNNATAMRESPLWRVRFANLIQKTNRKGGHYIQDGLLVAPTSFSFEPNQEAGFFIVDGKYNFPKEIKVSLAFAALHEETLGWLYDANKEGKKHRWISDINTTNDSFNQNSTMFPWGDYERKYNQAIESSLQASATDANLAAKVISGEAEATTSANNDTTTSEADIEEGLDQQSV
jgi:hypothetical protein